MAVVRAALDAVDAGMLVRRALAAPETDRALRSAAAIDVVAVGKAAAPMLIAFAAAAPVAPRRLIGIGPEPPATYPAAAVWRTTAHPVPDARSAAAAHEVLALARAADERDLLVLLLSGGASSLMALPADGVSLLDKQATSKRLLSLGGEIRELNAVRKHLSAIKGGQLAAANSGSTLTLALSDVVGDDLSAIGSGPTVADATTFQQALDVVDRYGGRDQFPRAVVDRLNRGAVGMVPETPKPGDPRLARSQARVIGGSRTALEGARTAAEALGYTTHVVERPVTGEAHVAAHELISHAGRVPRRKDDPTRRGPVGATRGGPATHGFCVLSAGETTVRTTGSGKGGRNQEFALAMARELDTLGSVVVAASVGTDGIDGPTDAAGAVVDSTTLARAEAADIGPPERYLKEHNSYVFFDELNDLIRTGPTGTNVGDLQVILIT